MVNEWTRNDLPDHVVIRDVDYMHGDGTRSRVIDLTLDTVVGHLNANHQKPEPDRWRRAHEIVERERDQAREERDDAEQRYRDTAKALTEWHGRWVEMERDRDEWKARAEAAGVAGTRNQLAAVHPDQPADWHVQTGTVEWETP